MYNDIINSNIPSVILKLIAKLTTMGGNSQIKITISNITNNANEISLSIDDFAL